MISAIIIFNLALTHHLEALETQQICNTTVTSTLRKSAKLYQLAFNMLQEVTVQSNNLIFAMATVNNLGLVFEMLEDDDAAHECFEQLLSTLMFLVDCGDGAAVSKFGNGVFFRTISHLISRADVAAAAA